MRCIAQGLVLVWGLTSACALERSGAGGADRLVAPDAGGTGPSGGLDPGGSSGATSETSDPVTAGEGGLDDGADRDAGNALRPEDPLESPVIADGGEFPVEYTCDGDDRSPPLRWNNGPEGVQSYAISLTDLDASVPGGGALVHWVLWDIPATVTALPERVGEGHMPVNVPGAKQVRAFSAFGGAIGGFDYAGPCPRPEGTRHTYELSVFALSIPSLVGLDNNAQPGQVVQAIEQGGFLLSKRTLTASYTGR